MNNIDYKSIIASSWLLTRKNKRLIWWYGFFPSLLTTLVGIFYLFYQIVATYRSKLFVETEKSFLRDLIETVLLFIKNNPQEGTVLLIVVFIILLMYLVLPTIFQGGLIQLAARVHNNQEVKMLQGVSYGMLSFLPLLEYHLLVKSFGLFSVLAEAAFIGRNLGWEVLKLLFFPLLLFAIIGLILVFIFTYTEYFIVIDAEGVFTAIRKSGRLIIQHWAQTFLLFILMLIISIRIFVNIILVILIPALIIIPAGYIASVTFASVGYIIGGLIGVVALFFAAYLGGILTVFATFVWVKTFLQLTTTEEKSAREMTARG